MAAPALFGEFLRPHLAGGNGIRIPPGQKIQPFRPRTSINQRSRTDKDSFLIAQFRFQTFKKCFYAKCHTIFVPGDFKASSPRRMFCSVECFDTHWREKLCKYAEVTD